MSYPARAEGLVNRIIKLWKEAGMIKKNIREILRNEQYTNSFFFLFLFFVFISFSLIYSLFFSLMSFFFILSHLVLFLLLCIFFCCVQSSTSPGGNTQQDTNCTATCPLSRKLFKLDEPDMQDIAGEAEMNS